MSEGVNERIVVQGVDDDAPAGYERTLDRSALGLFLAGCCILYAVWHIYVLTIAPLETIAFRLLHVTGALMLGYALARPRTGGTVVETTPGWGKALETVAGAGVLYALAMVGVAYWGLHMHGQAIPEPWVFANFGQVLLAGVALAVVLGWVLPDTGNGIPLRDWVLVAASLAAGAFLLYGLDNLGYRLRAGTGRADPQNGWAALIGLILILELTRRVAGLALVIIAAIFVAYAFLGPLLPGILEHRGYTAWRAFSYIFTERGVLGPTTAVSSTYIILFIIFAAFLQASRVGDYFVNFAFAAAGHARGGPAKVAVFASGLMGMINGTSAGNVVATGSLTIPLMKKVGYRPQTAAAVEAAASTGGQIMPPIMGAGAFIMAEVTGIPYTEIAMAAIIPAVLYFISVYFMVDFEARRLGMSGIPRDQLPEFAKLARQAFLFLPIVILVGALFAGYSVIRAGAYGIASAAVVSWLTPHAMGPLAIAKAFALASRMAIQIIAVCASAGIIVGVIALTGVGARFSSVLLALAETNQLIALMFAMAISIVLGMGMPTTAAYAVAASVVAPGLIQLGIQPLVAHFFVFYFAVISAITPPVALAAYAGAAIAGSEPMRTSVESFRMGMSAFIVPFMFFYSPALLLIGQWWDVAHFAGTAIVGVYLLSAAVVGWFFGRTALPVRIALLAAALLMIAGGIATDVAGVALAVGAWLYQTRLAARTA